MINRLAPLLLVVAGSVIYHVAAKSIPKSFDPMAAVVGLYVTALVASAIAFAGLRSAATPLSWSRLWHPTIAAVGLGALLIEIGFLLAYRSAWPVGTTSVITNGLAAILLFGIGASLFGEPVTPAKLFGVLLCLAGLSLLQR